VIPRTVRKIDDVTERTPVLAPGFLLGCGRLTVQLTFGFTPM